MHRPCVPASHCRADPAGERVIGERAPFEAEGKYVSQWLPKALALVSAQLPGAGLGSLPASSLLVISWLSACFQRQPACLQLAACLLAGVRHVLYPEDRPSRSAVDLPEMRMSSMVLQVQALCCVTLCVPPMLCCAVLHGSRAPKSWLRRSRAWCC